MRTIITKTSDLLIVCATFTVICFAAGHLYAQEQAAERKHALAMQEVIVRKYERAAELGTKFGCLEFPVAGVER